MARHLFDHPQDLLALPGSWTTTTGLDGTYSEDQFVTQMQALTRAIPNGGARKEHDPNWRSSTHHALGKVKDLSSLNDLIAGYRKTLPRARKFEEARFKEWMQHYSYKEKTIKAYIRFGGLPLLLQEMERLYFSLLMAVQAEGQAAAPRWSGTYAEAMVKHHSKELGYIRNMAGNREGLFLASYTYLRDQARTRWTNQEVSDLIIREWTLANNAGSGEGASEAPSRRQCRCQNRKLHTQLNITYYDGSPQLCPVAAATSAQLARKAAKLLVTKLEGHEGTPTPNQWKGWATKAVEAAVAGRDSIP